MSEAKFGDGPLSITFNDLKKLNVFEQIKFPLIVTTVKPLDLYTTQSWMDIVKVQIALNRKADPNDIIPTVGYIHKGRIGGLKIILGDGNTKAIVAIMRGLTVQVEVKGFLPDGTRYIPLKRLYQDNSDLFSDFNYR